MKNVNRFVGNVNTGLRFFFSESFSSKVTSYILYDEASTGNLGNFTIQYDSMKSDCCYFFRSQSAILRREITLKDVD